MGDAKKWRWNEIGSIDEFGGFNYCSWQWGTTAIIKSKQHGMSCEEKYYKNEIDYRVEWEIDSSF